MGFKRNNKLKKLEKAKVKLKAKKTVLAKAKNITDTSFKVRKIVVREQLKSQDGTQLLTTKKQNIKELLSKLRHHNLSVKKNCLEGLKELFVHYPEEIIGVHLSALIEGISQLILDEEREIRKEAVKLLGLILGQVPESKVVPFFNVLLSYLGCGMTHIHISVQDDSLTMLDTLLASVPMLVAANSQKVLTNFLDMISSQKTDSTSDRALSVNLTSKFTTVNWRTKVLQRLHSLLSAMVKLKTEQNSEVTGSYTHSNENVSQHWTKVSELYTPVLASHFQRTCFLPSIFGSSYGSSDNYNDGNNLKSYAKVLKPLLLETWFEVRPSSERRKDKDTESLLSQDAAVILKLILEIISLLFELLKLWKLDSDVPEVIAAYKKDFLEHIFPGFPYSCSDMLVKKREKKEAKKDHKLKSMNTDSNCHSQNFAICMLFCSFTNGNRVNAEQCARVLKYIRSNVNKKKLNNKNQIIQLLQHMFSTCGKSWNQHDIDMEPLIESIVNRYMKTLDEDLLCLLSEIAFLSNSSDLQRNKSFQKWLEFLPNLLCSSSISTNSLNVLIKLAVQNNPFFYSSLCQKLPEILDNLNNITVAGTENEVEGRKSVGHIFPWIDDWSQEAVNALSVHLQCAHWNKELSLYILSLLKSRDMMIMDPLPAMTPKHTY